MTDNPLSPLERAEEALFNLGLTRSAARLYLALLERHPATGYELASRSGVPRAAIYNTLSTLEKEGLVSRIQDNPARYEPLAPDRLVELFSVRMKRRVESLRESLENLARPALPSGTWNIVGYDALLEQARLLIQKSQQFLALSIWQREALALEPELRDTAGRDCEIIVFSFTPVPTEIGRVFSYNIAEAELERHWPHKLILVSDGQGALMGNASQDAQNRAVLTREPSLVEMATANIVMDLTLFGQRYQQDVSPIVSRMTRYLAPVEQLAVPTADSLTP